MNLPLDIPALLKAATDIDEARNTPLAVSVYIDETAPGDVVGHVRSAFASAGAKTRVTIGYLDDNLLAEPYGADDMAVIVAGDSPRIGEQAAQNIVEERKNGKFLSAEELAVRCPKASKAVVELLDQIGALGSMPKTTQISLFA